MNTVFRLLLSVLFILGGSGWAALAQGGAPPGLVIARIDIGFVRVGHARPHAFGGGIDDIDESRGFRGLPSATHEDVVVHVHVGVRHLLGPRSHRA